MLERSGMAHNQLLLADVQAALQVSMRAGREGKPEHQAYGRGEMPTLLHGVYGLGSKDFNKYDAAAVMENMVGLPRSPRGKVHRDFFWASRTLHLERHPSRLPGAGGGDDLYRGGRRRGEDRPGDRRPRSTPRTAARSANTSSPAPATARPERARRSS